MLVIYFIASIIGLILIMAGIFVSASPASEILVAFGMLVLFTEVLFLVESIRLSIDLQSNQEDDKKDGDNNE